MRSKLFALSSLALITAAPLAGCGGAEEESPTDQLTGGGDLTVSAIVRRDDSYFPPLGTSEQSNPVWVNVRRGDVPVSDARVVVAGTEIPFEGTIFKQYYAELSGTPFVPGQDVTVEITVDGKTALETIRFPGGITVTEDGSSVSWSHEGNGDHLYVQPVDDDGFPSSDATLESYTGNNCEASTNIDSPYSVAGAAYPSAGDYLFTMVVRELKSGVFAGLPGIKTGTLEATDLKSVGVAK
jgi:hypothetical protein